MIRTCASKPSDTPSIVTPKCGGTNVCSGLMPAAADAAAAAVAARARRNAASLVTALLLLCETVSVEQGLAPAAVLVAAAVLALLLPLLLGLVAVLITSKSFALPVCALTPFAPAPPQLLSSFGDAVPAATAAAAAAAATAAAVAATRTPVLVVLPAAEATIDARRLRAEAAGEKGFCATAMLPGVPLLSVLMIE